MLEYQPRNSWVQSPKPFLYHFIVINLISFFKTAKTKHSPAGCQVSGFPKHAGISVPHAISSLEASLTVREATVLPQTNLNQCFFFSLIPIFSQRWGCHTGMKFVSEPQKEEKEEEEKYSLWFTWSPYPQLHSIRTCKSKDPGAILVT